MYGDMGCGERDRGRKNLRVLFLNNSNIELVQNNTFNGLPAVTVLHLENNKIAKLEGDEFQGLTSLRELYLQDNIISSIKFVPCVLRHLLGSSDSLCPCRRYPKMSTNTSL